MAGAGDFLFTFCFCIWKFGGPKICKPSAGSRAAYAQVTANVFVFTQKIEFYFVLEKRKAVDRHSVNSESGWFEIGGDKSNKISFVMSVNE